MNKTKTPKKISHVKIETIQGCPDEETRVQSKKPALLGLISGLILG